MARVRCGGHREDVGRLLVLGPEAGALLDSETVLFVDDDQPQVGEFHIVLDQRVGAYRNVYIALQQICLNLSLFLGGAGAGEQAQAGVCACKEFLQCGIVLGG